MWQKCPVCLGTGVDNNIIIFNKEIKCTACDGKKNNKYYYWKKEK